MVATASNGKPAETARIPKSQSTGASPAEPGGSMPVGIATGRTSTIAPKSRAWIANCVRRPALREIR